MGMCRKIQFIAIIFGILFALVPFGVMAQESVQNNPVFNNSGLAIPRFVSLASDKVFVRTGPALRYPIKWVYKQKGLPVEIVQEFDTWRKIRDFDGEEGWIHTSLLSGKRRALVENEDGAILLRKPSIEAKQMAVAEKGVIVSLESCSGDWCAVSADGYEGWVQRKLLWGVYEREELD